MFYLKEIIIDREDNGYFSIARVIIIQKPGGFLFHIHYEAVRVPEMKIRVLCLRLLFFA